MSGSRSAELDRILKQSSLSYDRLNKSLQEFSIKEIDRVRLELNDLLIKYTGKDDTIKRKHIISLISDLNRIEKSVRDNGMRAMNEVINQSVAYGANAGKEGLTASIGADVIDEVLTGAVFSRVSADAVRYVTNRFGNDGLVLSDRVWNLAKGQRAELEKVIRSGIIRGESVNSLIAQVRKVYANETWKIRRLVITEGNTANRTGSAYVAQASNFVKGLRIHHGIANVATHRCSELEKIDRYGLGKGVYIPTDPEVLNPHPNCTSYVTYELIEDVEGEIADVKRTRLIPN